MACCRDGTILLDADQEVPPYVDEVFFKWRFYLTDYEPKSQKQAFHIEWALNGCDSGGPQGIPTACSHIEYDVPQAAPGTPRCAGGLLLRGPRQSRRSRGRVDHGRRSLP